MEDFAAFVCAGGEVTRPGFKERIKKAEALVFLKLDGRLKGIGAVKKPNPDYKEGVFKKAQATFDADQFQFELGWIFIHPSSRGACLSYKIVEAALSVICGQPIFATSRADNKPMHKALKKHGLNCHGRPYASSRGDYQLVLFVRNPTQQGAPSDGSI